VSVIGLVVVFAVCFIIIIIIIIIITAVTSDLYRLHCTIMVIECRNVGRCGVVGSTLAFGSIWV